ncbi:MAG TPA: efflux RND transporter periplasmic adaptor subunit [Acidobacteriaceae bacterium]|jgi:RND family efflux transporter MFP subunit|nr:efflux RND transporter periplasmic adaptor subunit [Acidobacteriaceae bacterium]
MNTQISDTQSEQQKARGSTGTASQPGLEPGPEPNPEFGPEPRTGRWHTVVIVLAVLAIVVFGIRTGIRSRARAEERLVRQTRLAAVPSVAVIHPKLGSASQEISLPGNTLPYIDTPIYARTSGYLRKWYFDIGAHVKKGDLLAVIETPELDEQLDQANAELKTAQANLQLAQITAERWQHLLKTNSVSQQETDQAVSDYAAKQAMVASNEANVRRLQQLQAYEKIYAPFDGVITQRNTDIGDLIDAGQNTAPRELFHLASISTLRVYIPVPEVDANAVRTGEKVALTLDEYPDQQFTGTLVRNSDAIDPASRTLNVEVDVANPQGRLRPGSYVFVHLKMPADIGAVTIPANTLLFRSEGLRVGVVRKGHAQLVPITVGRDYGSSVEVVAGLTPSDAVILNPSDSLESGQAVQIAKDSQP